LKPAPAQFDSVRVVTPDLGYVVGFERGLVRRVGSDAEEDGWKLSLRHADRVAQPGDACTYEDVLKLRVTLAVHSIDK
jgi:hypothetical protein